MTETFARVGRATVLDNGVTVVSERMPAVRSVSLGLWITCGSRDEAAELGGTAHFLEHMLFKGTVSRSARDIALEIDAMGGQLDAFTAKEHACYYATVLDENLQRAFELLADLVGDPRLASNDMEIERGVILEEIAGVDDFPEEVLYERFAARFWPRHGLGRPILGTRETVTALRPEQLRAYLESVSPSELIVAAAGNVDHEALTVLADRLLGGREASPPPEKTEAPVASRHCMLLTRHDLEQAHLYVAGPGRSANGTDRYALHLLDTLLGGSVSSRLFQVIREEHGLAYNVYSSIGVYADAGYVWISAATGRDAVGKVLELVASELEALCDRPIESEELTRVKDHVKGSMMLGLENSSSRMSNLARQQISFGRSIGLQEILSEIDAVSLEQVQALGRELFDPAALSVGVLCGRDADTDITSDLSGRLESLGFDAAPELHDVSRAQPMRSPG